METNNELKRINKSCLKLAKLQFKCFVNILQRMEGILDVCDGDESEIFKEKLAIRILIYFTKKITEMEMTDDKQ